MYTRMCKNEQEDNERCTCHMTYATTSTNQASRAVCYQERDQPVPLVADRGRGRGETRGEVFPNADLL